MAWNDSNYKAVSGVFSSENDVQGLLNDLDTRGIGSDLVNIMMSDTTQKRYPSLNKENKMPEGASAGGLTGGLLGALAGGLTMAGSLLVPGLNVLVAGPIIGALAGGAIGSATGSLVGALVGAGIPEYEAKTYEKNLSEEGNVLVIAHIILDEVDDVKALFIQHRAHDLAVVDDASTTTSPVG